jgi:hypothetical protein
VTVTEAEERKNQEGDGERRKGSRRLLGCPLALEGGDSDERANLQQTFYRELLAANGNIGRLDGLAGCYCGEVRLVATTKLHR